MWPILGVKCNQRGICKQQGVTSPCAVKETKEGNSPLSYSMVPCLTAHYLVAICRVSECSCCISYFFFYVADTVIDRKSDFPLPLQQNQTKSKFLPQSRLGEDRSQALGWGDTVISDPCRWLVKALQPGIKSLNRIPASAERHPACSKGILLQV